MVDHFNRVAVENGWQIIEDAHKMKGIRTRLPCRTLAISPSELHMKVPSHRPD